MTEHHYNTTHESGSLLQKFESQGKSQEARLLKYFQANPASSWTRSELHRVIMRKCPVSSITRALANLKNRGLIERTADKRDGDFGRPMYLWRLASREGDQHDMFPLRFGRSP